MSIISDIGGTTQNSFSINGKLTLYQISGNGDPSILMGKNGDICSNEIGTIFHKHNNIWRNLVASQSLPVPSHNKNKLFYSDGESFVATDNLNYYDNPPSEYNQESINGECSPVLMVKNEDYPSEVASNETSGRYIGFTDQNDELEGYLEFVHNNTASSSDSFYKSKYIAMNVCENGFVQGTLGVGIDSNGDLVTHSPQPRTISTDDEIATVGWVKNNVNTRKMGQFITSLTPLDDPYLKLCNGQMLSKESYPDFWQHLIDTKNNHPLESNIYYFSGSSTTINRDVSQKGYYFINDSYIWLPELSGIKSLTPTNSDSTVGLYTSAGLPNIYGEAYNIFTNRDDSYNGALIKSNSGNIFNVSTSSGSAHNFTTLILNAQSSNGIYGNSTTVQPEAVNIFVYVVVAHNFKNETGSIDITALVNEINDYQNQLNSLSNTVGVINTNVYWLSNTVSQLNNSVNNLNNRISYGSNWIKDNTTGFIIQWGYCSDVVQTVTFSIPFSSSTYSVATSENINGHTYSPVAKDKTTTSFSWSVDRSGDWIALGY